MQLNKLDYSAHQGVETQQRLYYHYALAAEKYVKKPTILNWERKEKAFEEFNALFKDKPTIQSN